MTNRNYLQRTQAGIALLMTIIVLGVVLSVTLAIVELSLQHLALSVDSKDSEIAFHAANAGLECARYMRRSATSSPQFETGLSTITPSCFGTTTPSFSKRALIVSSSSPNAIATMYRYKANIASNNNRCSAIDMLVMVVSSSSPESLVVTGPGGSDLSLVFPGYGPTTKTCDPGASCTLVSVSGYNALCNGITADGVLKRQVLLEF